jgi:hypothetical protein
MTKCGANGASCTVRKMLFTEFRVFCGEKL